MAIDKPLERSDRPARAAGSNMAETSLAAASGGGGVRALRQLRVVSPGRGYVTRFAWSPGGSHLAAATSGGEVVVVPASGRGRRRSILAHGDRVLSLAWSPCGGYLATGSDDCSVRLFSVGPGRERLHEPARFLLQDAAPVVALSWSPCGGFLAAGFIGGRAPVVICPSTAEVVGELSEEGEAWTMAWSPDGRYLAVGAEGGEIRLYLVDEEGKLSRHCRLSGHAESVIQVSWAPDSSRLASAGCGPDAVLLWDAATGAPACSLRGHSAAATGVSVSHDARFAASKADDHTVRVYRLPEGRSDGACATEGVLAVIEEAVSPAASFSPNVAFHPAMPLLATIGSGGDTIRIWDLTPDEER